MLKWFKNLFQKKTIINENGPRFSTHSHQGDVIIIDNRSGDVQRLFYNSIHEHYQVETIIRRLGEF